VGWSGWVTQLIGWVGSGHGPLDITGVQRGRFREMSRPVMEGILICWIDAEEVDFFLQ